MSKKLSLGDIFTDAELERVRRIYLETPEGSFRARVVEEVVKDAMPRIDAKTGQANDADYMGYMLEFAMMQMGLVAGSEVQTSPGKR